MTVKELERPKPFTKRQQKQKQKRQQNKTKEMLTKSCNLKTDQKLVK